MNLQDLRRIVEEHATGYLQWKKREKTYASYDTDAEQYKQFKAFLRAEFLQRFKRFNAGKVAKIVINSNHEIHEVNKKKPRSDDAYYGYRGKVKVPNRVDRESFELKAEFQMADGNGRYYSTRHSFAIEFIRHEKNMNWQTNYVSCHWRSPRTYNDKTSNGLVFIARELEGLFGVEDSLVEKTYKNFKEKLEENIHETVNETRKPSGNSTVVARRVRPDGNQCVARATERPQVENSEVELRFTEGTSNKFYRIKIEGGDGSWDAVAYYGRIDASPAVSHFSMNHVSRADAVRAARNQMARKIQKGYAVYIGDIL